MDEQSAETQAFNAKISRQRLDYVQLPGGSWEAVLTITLPGVAKPFVFREPATIAEAQADAGDAPEVAGIFDAIGKGLKSIGKTVVGAVKSVASSKVFKTAAKGLALAAPVLGPLAPVALTASGAMLTTSALVGARRKAAHGDKRGAVKLTAEAQAIAKKLAPKNHKALLKVAADKSRGAHKISAEPTKTKGKAKTKTKTKAPARAPSRALPAGRSPVSAAALLAAARSGRVYLVQPRAA